MHSYLPALLRASQSFLAHISSDPSIYGVSAAFLGCEEEFDSAFVAYSGIVGEIFSEKVNKLQRRDRRPSASRGANSAPAELTLGQRNRSKSGFASRYNMTKPWRTSEPPPLPTINGDGKFLGALGNGLSFPLPSPDHHPNPAESSRTKSGLGRTLSIWRKSVPSLTTMVTPTPPLSAIMVNTHAPRGSAGKHSRPSTADSMASSFGGSTYGGFGMETKKVKKERKPPLRDLAIQPTQRVTRYVLQYRDLLNNTSVSSPSRVLVERALEGAMRIATKCDRAQDNAAFLRRS
ncbi:hypothetical protein JAAARDRAFT_368068 [Jaapia argillacea MUCL 33604]|uniref:DH domain-containing protein n=1 Tax=Jaapia argillacea MUCL 33604 TaxID=933084 RepID=A0A067Q7V5_9AGAM|nr:hypothetical protein JAAARDRAFT_368068 [Jaapia argillacea MUCL 33604]